MSFGSDSDPPRTLTAAASFWANGSLSDLISDLIDHLTCQFFSKRLTVSK